MALAFDHTQYLTDIRMALGEADDEIIFIAPFTEQEFMRALVDPGFSGSIRFIEADLVFQGGVDVIQNVTWKWQARSLGASAWVDLHTAVTEQWIGGTQTGLRLGLDAAGLGVEADAVPLEMRLLVSAPTAAEVSVHIGDVRPLPAVRVFGETL